MLSEPSGPVASRVAVGGCDAVARSLEAPAWPAAVGLARPLTRSQLRST